MTQGSWRQFDWLLLGATIILTVFGILMIRSATLGAIDPDLINRVPDQIRFSILGLLVLFGLATLDYRLLGGLHQWLYIFMIVLLLLVQFFGVEGDGGAQSWLNIGIRIQPSEIAKVLIIITLGMFLARNWEKMGELSTIIKSGIHIGIPTALIFIQPDLGMTIVFAVMWIVMVWASGLRLKHIATFLLIVAISAPVTIPVVWSQMEGYQRQRITSFLFPESDRDAYYNILQARITIGSGGLLGKGYAQGPQNTGRFLRVRHTDFIFAVIAEEFGFVGGVTVMGLIGFVIFRILRGARLAPDPFGSLVCYGVATFIFFQTMVSIGMNLTLMPVTGLTLPFISSGGTSLLSTLAGIGLAQSVIMRRRRI
ncbi:MAG: rod shape-determining protein RodA [Chloroflexi bacterium]|uniref:FtsW/RodA/SpoVE family cell cycle protein n=1 Tax=Candidatus Flexifilum breve TaxID=3140694 RepID=UPI0031366CDA|nr:rod shape-determining protein RodA [Chloroflexota bacterium]